MKSLADNPFVEVPPFKLRTHATSRALFTSAQVEDAERDLLDTLEALPQGGLLVVDFSSVRIASEAARQLLRRALRRLGGGELADRYLVLGDLGDSLYNVEAMLIKEALTVVERSEDEGPQLRGQVDPAMRETYHYLLTVPTATASMVQKQFALANISTATNRLSNLARLALARRVEQRAVAGGGREFVYAAVQ